MGSSRLPGKSMKPLAGRPLVRCVLERLRHARSLHGIVLATTTAARDDVLVELAASFDVPAFRGSEQDVLARILGAARAQGASVHVQCWGDCPFLDAGEVDRVVAGLLDRDADVAGNGLGPDRQLPYGLDVIALRVDALARAEEATRDDPYHREHGTTYLYQNPDRFRVAALETPPALRYPALDVTINTADDYAFIDAVYRALGPRALAATAREVLDVMRTDPALRDHPKTATLRGDAPAR
jgi:spore coat polysaccharide biosynthesis protein SpsF